MKKLQCLVVAEPSESAAKQIIGETERLAERRVLARTGDEAVRLVAESSPEMLLLSLEVASDPSAVVQKIRKSRGDLFMVATFRELAVPSMNKLAKAGIDDFVPQPIDYTQLYRSASNHFGTFFRRHARYSASLEVLRVDGVLIGKTVDISEGGLRLECFHPTHQEQSMLVDLALPGEPERRIRVRCMVLEVSGEAPQKVTARAQFQNLRGEEHHRLIEFLAELARKIPDLDA